MPPEDLQRTLGNLEAKVDILLERSSATSSAHSKLVSRVSHLEGLAHSTRAFASVVAVCAAILASLFSGYFNK